MIDLRVPPRCAVRLEGHDSPVMELVDQHVGWCPGSGNLSGGREPHAFTIGTDWQLVLFTPDRALLENVLSACTTAVREVAAAADASSGRSPEEKV